jgi:hypothetical protein
MPAPIRLVGPSPYAKFSHPPRGVDHGVDGDHPEAFAVFMLGAIAGALLGLAFAHYWREVTTIALLTLVSVGCGLGIAKIDRGQW